MKRQIINGQQVNVAETIVDFVIKQKDSSNVDYFGYGPTGDIFVQFKNGSAYIYKNTSEELVGDLVAAESIGKFVGRLNSLETVKQPRRLVELVKEEHDADA